MRSDATSAVIMLIKKEMRKTTQGLAYSGALKRNRLVNQNSPQPQDQDVMDLRFLSLTGSLTSSNSSLLSPA